MSHRADRNLGRFRIGPRLTLCFTTLLLMMAVGSGVAFWQFRVTQVEAERVYQVNLAAQAVLRLQIDVLTFWKELEGLIGREDEARFAVEAARRRQIATAGTDRAIRAIAAASYDVRRALPIREELQTIRVALSEQIDAMIDLTRAGDWPAARRRLEIEVKTHSDVIESLVGDLNTAVEHDQAESLDNIGRVQRRALLTLSIAALLTLGLAASLGVAVTRSITRPLARLNAAEQALSRGDFEQRVEVVGRDELADLARAFNATASSLSGLYEALRRDIAERKQVEEALRRSEEEYRLFFELDLSGNYVSTPDGRLLMCNPAFARMFGFQSAREALEWDMTMFYPAPTARQRFIELLRERKRIEYYEQDLRRRDGSVVHVIENASGSFNDRGELVEVRGYLIDQTERKTIEHQLRQSQKLEAIGRLAGGVAHDFNNLLTAILGYCEIVMATMPATDPLRRDLQQIDAAGKMAAGLTAQLLAFSRKQVLQPKVLTLNATVAGMEGLLRRLLGEDIEIAIVADPALGRVIADPIQMEQVIINLAVNARDAMPGGGKLTIETANAYLDEAYVHRHAGVREGAYVMLAVSDTGHGMDAETQSHLFEPFFTTKGPGEGTGLGLSTVYGIVTQSGGHIWAYSEVRHGTTFKVYLPRVDAAVEPAAPPEPIAALPRGTESILLVEDEDVVRTLAAAVMRNLGYTVLVASNGAEAEAVSEEHRAVDIQLLITDVVMPRMGGKELAARLKRTRPGMRVLFISGYVGNSMVVNGQIDEGSSFLQKPFVPSRLARKIREVLDGAV